jgi:DNA-damage-inducible protein D
MMAKKNFGQLVSYLAKGTGMANEIEVFHFDQDRPSFESYGRDNGFRYWLASQLMELLNYATMQPINKAVNNAMAACAQLGVSIPENFQETKSNNGDRDWRLSRFACYLTVMNGDPKNPRVAQAQAYFVTIAQAFQQYIHQTDGVERVLIRGEVSDREKALSATASVHGVEQYQFFQNAGYRGMYNMDLAQIRVKKGIPSGRSPLDFMGKTELAANLFRLTQTEEKIRNEDIRGQKPLERVAHKVGREVRDTMIRLSGTSPEALPPAQDIKEVRKGIKGVGKVYAKLDKPKREKI